MTAPVDYQRFDHQRFIAVIMDTGGELTTAEFDAQASQEEIARALCDNELRYPIHSIVEFRPTEGRSQDVTEDVARLIPAISAEAWRDDGRRVRASARVLMARYEIDDPADEASSDTFSALSQLGADRAKEARIMSEAM